MPANVLPGGIATPPGQMLRREWHCATWKRLHALTGMAAPIRVPMRIILPDTIVLSWVTPDIDPGVFVRNNRFNRHYDHYFTDKEHRTIETDPRRREFGAPRT